MSRRRNAAGVIALCLAVFALPAVAYAGTPSFASLYPANGSNVIASPPIIGANVLSSGVRLSRASMSISGGTLVGTVTLRPSITQAGAESMGTWSASEVTRPNGLIVIKWTWIGVPGPNVNCVISATPPKLGPGLYTVVASATDYNGATTAAGPWTFTVGPALPTFGTVVSPAAYATTSTATPEISVAVYGATSTTATINGVAATTSNGGLGVLVTPGAPLANGVQQVIVTAANAAGRASKAWRFTVKVVEPADPRCAPCHAGLENDPIMGPDCTWCHRGKVDADGNVITHGYPAEAHVPTVTMGTITILGTAYANRACADCHDLELGPLHIPPATCETCHDSLVPIEGGWDKGCVQAGCHPAGSSLEMHADVDAAHLIGPQTCLLSGCHTGAGNLAAVHSGASTTAAGVTLTSCDICHAAGRTPSATCSDCHNMTNPHPDNAAAHQATPEPEIITISGISFGTHACDECHIPTNLLDLHNSACASCHPTPKDTVAGTWTKGCVQAGCHPVGSDLEMHASIDASHAIPASRSDCLASGCHDAGAISPFEGKSVAEIHSEATTTTPTGTRTSCQICHAQGVTPTADCLTSGCHPERAEPHGFDPLQHTAAPTSPETGTWPYVDTAANWNGLYFNAPYVYSFACSDCHDLQIAAEHAKPTASSAAAGCDNCHPTPADPLIGVWDKSCAQGGCHTVAGTTKHEALTPAHAMAQSDVEAGCGFVSPDNGRRPCHYADIVQEHNRTISPSVDPPNSLITKTFAITCEQCHSSAAFAALAGNWDGTCTACHDGTTLPNHTIEGTARHDAVYAKHGAVGSNTMDSHGWIRVNPDPNSANKTIGCGIPTCHTNAYVGGGWPFPEDAKYCYQCHDYDAGQHTGTPTPTTYTISGLTFGPFPCANCHNVELGPEHVKPAPFSGTEGCETCHPSPRNTFSTWDKTTCVQGGCHSVTSSAPMHASIDASHAIPASRSDCLASGCHDAGAISPFEGKSVAEIHSQATTPDGTRTSCQICHAQGVTPTADCLTSGCHPERAQPHGYDPLKHISSGGSDFVSVGMDDTTHYYGDGIDADCSACHVTDLGTLHKNNCQTCHSSSVRDAVKTAITTHDTNCTTLCHPSHHSGDIPEHYGEAYNDCYACHLEDPDDPDANTWNVTCLTGGCHPGPY